MCIRNLNLTRSCANSRSKSLRIVIRLRATSMISSDMVGIVLRDKGDDENV